MGQKTDPRSFRVGFNRANDGDWFTNSRKDYVSNLKEDMILRNFIDKNYRNYHIDRVFIRRPSNSTIELILHTSKMGVVLGKKGEGVEKMRKTLSSLTDKKLNIKVKGIKNHEIKARILGLQIAESIEKRTPFKKAMNYAMQKAKKSNVEGIKITVSGRLNGAEIARAETMSHGKVPLHSKKYVIDYAVTEAHTISGIIGIKVWVCSGVSFGVENVDA